MNAHNTELLIQLSRRQLWAALSLILLLGLSAIAIVGFPGSRIAASANKLWMIYPVVVAIQLAAMRSSAKRAGADVSAAQVRRAVDDELRRDSLRRGYRNGFIAMLAAQPLLSFALASSTATSPVAVMGIASVLAGVVVALASLLYYDR